MNVANNVSTGLPEQFRHIAADYAQGLRELPPDEIALNVHSIKTINPETLAGACRWIMDGLAACGLASYDDPNADLNHDLSVG